MLYINAKRISYQVWMVSFNQFSAHYYSAFLVEMANHFLPFFCELCLEIWFNFTVEAFNYRNVIMQRAQREPVIDDERLNSARRRLQENYQEAQNGLLLIFGTCCYTRSSTMVLCSFMLIGFVYLFLVYFCMV